MLVLTRQRDESIRIGDDIIVTLVDIRGDRVRLGIEAPKDMSIHRQEVYDAIKRENRMAAQMVERTEDVTPPGSVLKVERIVLTPAGRKALSLGGVPAAQAAPAAKA